MWQPNRAQWSIIWTVAVLLVLAWPPDTGKSLAVKCVNWAADPSGALPNLPQPLPMALDDDGDAVSAHDMLEADYYRMRNRSAVTRWRMDLKEAEDPFNRQTERQLLMGLGVLAVLAVWRLQDSSSPPKI
jgi:hypothetical protein